MSLVLKIMDFLREVGEGWGQGDWGVEVNSGEVGTCLNKLESGWVGKGRFGERDYRSMESCIGIAKENKVGLRATVERGKTC